MKETGIIEQDKREHGAKDTEIMGQRKLGIVEQEKLGTQGKGQRSWSKGKGIVEQEKPGLSQIKDLGSGTVCNEGHRRPLCSDSTSGNKSPKSQIKGMWDQDGGGCGGQETFGEQECREVKGKHTGYEKHLSWHLGTRTSSRRCAEAGRLQVGCGDPQSRVQSLFRVTLEVAWTIPKFVLEYGG